MRKRRKRPIFDEKKSCNNRGSKKENKFTHSTYIFDMIREKTLFLHITNKYVVMLRKSNSDLCSYFKIIRIKIIISRELVNI